jgi:hypothetical protein
VNLPRSDRALRLAHEPVLGLDSLEITELAMLIVPAREYSGIPREVPWTIVHAHGGVVGFGLRIGNRRGRQAPHAGCGDAPAEF